MNIFTDSRASFRAVFGLCVVGSLVGGALVGSGCGTSDVASAPSATSETNEAPDFVEIEHLKVDGGDGDFPSPCTTPLPAYTIFCDDFDTEKQVSTGWTVEPDDHDGGVGRFGKVHYASAPKSYRAENGYYQQVALTGGSTTGFTFDFDLRVHEPATGNPGTTTPIAVIVDTDAEINISLALSNPPEGITNTFLSFYKNGPGGIASSSKPIPIDTWVHFEFVASDIEFELFQDGALVASSLIEPNPPPGQPPTAVAMEPTSLALGAGAQLGAGVGMVVNFDNVIIRSPSPPPVDGGTDSGVADSGTTYCSNPPANSFYCDDFDKPSEPSTGCTLGAPSFSAPDSCKLGNFTASATSVTTGATSHNFELYVASLPTAETNIGTFTFSATAGLCPTNSTFVCNNSVTFHLDQTGALSITTPAGSTIGVPTSATIGTLTVGTWNTIQTSLVPSASPAANFQVLLNGSGSGLSTGARIEPGPRSLELTYGSIDNVVFVGP